MAEKLNLKVESHKANPVLIYISEHFKELYIDDQNCANTEIFVEYIYEYLMLHFKCVTS